MPMLKKHLFPTLIISLFIFLGCEEVITDEWTLIPHNNGVGVWRGSLETVSGDSAISVANLRSDSAYIVTVELKGDTLYEEVGTWYLDNTAGYYTIKQTGSTYKHWDTAGVEVNISSWSTFSPSTEKTMTFDYNDHMNLIEGDYKYDNFTLIYQE